MYTKILRRWAQLSRNCKIDRKKRKYSIPRDSPKLYAYIRHSDILSAYSTEKVSVAPLVLSSGNVLERRCYCIHRRKTQSNVVAGADRLYSLRPAYAELANDLSLDIREVFTEREPESAAAERKDARCQGKPRKVYKGEINSKA